ncbi:hypothetical protein KJR58_24475 [Escherichia coli]|nr:hypothetical protein [Escherichia coli]
MLDRRQLKRVISDRFNNLLTLGDDFYTVGRPHPMIDPALRIS